MNDILNIEVSAAPAKPVKDQSAAHKPSNAKRIIPIAAPPIILMLAVLVIWQVITVIFDLPRYILPSPAAIAKAASERGGDLLRSAFNTSLSAFFGFLLSIVIGNLTALLMTASKWVQRSLSPYAIVLQTIPVVAVAPLIVIWFGTGMNSIIIISFIVAVFPIISNSNLGLNATDHNLVNLMRMYNGTGWKMMWKLRIPYAMPYILGGMKISCGLAVIGAIIGEFVAGIGGAKGGLGIAITSAAVQMQTPYLFACAITASLLGMIFFAGISILSHYVLRHWHESASQTEN
ncbi:ABC transporter permease [Paenibacillus sp. CF384]|uniref:ABC transporter permease n=1 Tax=Paenibacillus sp. CF384 TaxID=1884382 RepID=UPI00089A4DA1|nr:ABC transporter permease [Paenibacillus sp. CF384]SDX50781.1 NitT/TauT family transport system permease protein [Paenibacillus sp. CF384]